MAIEIKMPALSPTMESGTLSKWLVKEGDKVTSGDVIAEIETDKATMEVEAVDEGTVAKLAVPEGTEDVKVGTLIAVLAEEGEDVKSAASAVSAPAPAAAAPAPAQKAEAPAPQPAAPAVAAPVAPAVPEGGRVFASPLARRIAKQSGIDISAVRGTGPRGRIVKADVEKAKAGGVAAPAAAAQPVAQAAAPAPSGATVATAPNRPHEEQKLSSMRKVIARRMTESKQQVPHFYLSADIDLDPLLALRKTINSREGVKVSVNDLIIKAVAAALVKEPDMNVQYGGDKLFRMGVVDISVAVAIEGGLVTPVIKDADKKGLLAVSNEMKELAEKARTGKLMPEDYQGGCFSISNLGMFGVKNFDAVINPPQAGILAVGAGEQRPVVKDGALAIGTVMTVTLSVDHRAVDGAIGARWLKAFKELVEDPMSILL
jgi:pyruvate dehydrogenase E2 component (dihydrolipoamide acetyltransferase)